MDNVILYQPPSQVGSSQTAFISSCGTQASSLYKRGSGPSIERSRGQNYVECVPCGEPDDGVWIISPAPDYGLVGGPRPGPDRSTQTGGTQAEEILSQKNTSKWCPGYGDPNPDLINNKADNLSDVNKLRRPLNPKRERFTQVSENAEFRDLT
jgi:hypothetical protein